MEKWSVNSISLWLLLVSQKKKTWSRRIEYKSWKLICLWRRSPGTLTFLWKRSRIDRKEPLQEHISVSENLLYNIYFLLIKFSRISCTSLYLCPFLLFFQMLMKYLKINVLYEWNQLSQHFFATDLDHCFLWKASGSITISLWLSFSG